MAAAADAGLRLTLLDTCYVAGGLGAHGHAPLEGPQLRFGDGDAQAWRSRVEDRRDAGDGGGGGDDATFIFGAAGAPEMFDPFYATDGETFRVTRQMFEGLLGIEPGSAEVVPELATEWTPNEEGTEWTFTRRDDVT